MTLSRTAVLRPGDWVHFDGGEYQAIVLSGTSIRLHSEVADWSPPPATCR